MVYIPSRSFNPFSRGLKRVRAPLLFNFDTSKPSLIKRLHRTLELSNPLVYHAKMIDDKSTKGTRGPIIYVFVPCSRPSYSFSCIVRVIGDDKGVLHCSALEHHLESRKGGRGLDLLNRLPPLARYYFPFCVIDDDVSSFPARWFMNSISNYSLRWGGVNAALVLTKRALV